jgi:hypothetical protein
MDASPSSLSTSFARNNAKRAGPHLAWNETMAAQFPTLMPEQEHLGTQYEPSCEFEDGC